MPLTPVYNIVSTSCPAIQQSTANINPSDSTVHPTTAQGFPDGLILTQSVLEYNSKAIDTLGRYGAGGVCVTSGLGLVSGSGLSASVASGSALVDGPIYIASSTAIALTNNATNYVWLSQGKTIQVTTSTTPPGGNVYCYLGCIVVSSGTQTSVDYSGRVNKSAGVLVVGYGDTGAPAYSPPVAVMASTQGGIYFRDPIRNTWQGGVIDAKNFLIASTDSSAGYAINKILPGTNIAISHDNIGGSETMTISSTAVDKFVTVTGADTTPGNLQTKVLPGTGITMTVGSPGSAETYTIAANLSVIRDGKLLWSATDSTPNYLTSKLNNTGSTGLTFTVNNSGSNESVTIKHDGTIMISSTDTTRNYPLNKFTAANGTITITRTGSGSNEGLTWQANASAILDNKFKIASTDSTSDYAANKLVAGNGTITVGHTNIGGNETLTFQANPAAILDGKVKAGSLSTADYLGNVLVAGTGITLTPSTSTITISSSGGGGGVTVSIGLAGISGGETVTFTYSSAGTYSGRFWLSDSPNDVLTSTAPTGVTIYSNGHLLSALTNLKEYTFVTDSSGICSVNIANSGASHHWYVMVVQPDGTVVNNNFTV